VVPKRKIPQSILGCVECSNNNIILKVTAMVSDNIPQNSNPSYDMIEYKVCCSPTIRFNCRHGLIPLGKIMHDHNNVMVPPRRGWVSIHETYPPLGEGTDGNYWVKRGGVGCRLNKKERLFLEEKHARGKRQLEGKATSTHAWKT
jgi:hypothetical protein